MNDLEARDLLKQHAAAYGDARYEPARWVLDAIQAAVVIAHEQCAQICVKLPDDKEWSSFGSPVREVCEDAASRIRAHGKPPSESPR